MTGIGCCGALLRTSCGLNGLGQRRRQSAGVRGVQIGTSKMWRPMLCGMLRTTVVAVVFAFALSGCGSSANVPVNSPGTSAAHQPSDSATREAEAQPKTLEAAVASEQENADRYSSGDYAGQWLLYSRALRDAISQDDYAAFAERCVKETQRPEGLTFTVEGVRMNGDTEAIVRIGLLDIAKQSRTMVYEGGAWLREPTDELAANFGKPVPEWAC